MDGDQAAIRRKETEIEVSVFQVKTEIHFNNIHDKTTAF